MVCKLYQSHLTTTKDVTNEVLLSETFEGGGVCGTYDINSWPHFVPGLQIVPKSPGKHDVTGEMPLLPPPHLTKFEGNSACRT